ncbi:MAG: hypothetical protein DHS20C15_33590 [Planctomycetota bacterium]|nr:MAG: hypothetical protein DHS20C15_33590 [Planctomycetota bacterium]
MIPPADGAPQLFDAAGLALAADQPSDAPFAQLALDESPYAMHRRASLEFAFRLAGASRETLAKGLHHERWGQHVGAFAQLLALGLFARQGFAVQSEPEIGAQTPDLQIERDGDSALVEVRAITGCGQTPWEDAPHAPAEELPPLPRGLSKAAAAKQMRQRARRRAALQAEAERGADQDLDKTVLRVLEKKAAAYRDVCAEWELPYIIALYEDSDRRLSQIVRAWAYGDGDRELDPHGTPRSVHDPHDGAFFGDRYHFSHVSAVLIFGREAETQNQLLLRGDLLLNPFADEPLPDAWSFPQLRHYRLRKNETPPRMRWSPYEAAPFALVSAG